jgi:hypothetical protein
MLTLLSPSDVQQLQSYLVEVGVALENLTQVLEHAQTVQVALSAPVDVKAKSQSKTRASRRKRGTRALNAEQVAHIKGALQAGADVAVVGAGVQRASHDN